MTKDESVRINCYKVV